MYNPVYNKRISMGTALEYTVYKSGKKRSPYKKQNVTYFIHTSTHLYTVMTQCGTHKTTKSCKAIMDLSE